MRARRLRLRGDWRRARARLRGASASASDMSWLGASCGTGARNNRATRSGIATRADALSLRTRGLGKGEGHVLENWASNRRMRGGERAGFRSVAERGRTRESRLRLTSRGGVERGRPSDLPSPPRARGRSGRGRSGGPSGRAPTSCVGSGEKFFSRGGITFRSRAVTRVATRGDRPYSSAAQPAAVHEQTLHPHLTCARSVAAEVKVKSEKPG